MKSSGTVRVHAYSEIDEVIQRTDIDLHNLQAMQPAILIDPIERVRLRVARIEMLHYDEIGNLVKHWAGQYCPDGSLIQQIEITAAATVSHWVAKTP